MPKKKNTILIYLEYWGFMSVVILARWIPLRIAYALAGFLSGVAFFFDRRHRNRVIDHLIFAGVCQDRKEATKMARENFRQFGYLGVEIIKARQLLTPENIEDHIKFYGSKKSIEMFFRDEKPTNCIIMTAHYGNWEVAGLFYTILSGHHLLSVMRNFDNPLIGDFITRQREGDKHSLVPKERALKELLKALKGGESVCFLADQHAGRNEGVETKFFGKDVRTHSSPAVLHLKTGVPILLGIVKRVGYCQFEVFVIDPITMEPSDDKEGDIRKLTQLYTTELEKLIKEHGPEQWLWAHRRWLDLRKKTPREKKVISEPPTA